MRAKQSTGSKPEKNFKFKKLTIALMITGALLVAAAAVLEAVHYPWERILGLASQDEASVADPSPLDFIVPSPSGSASPLLSAAGLFDPSAVAVLPGAEEEDNDEETLEDYNFQILGVFKIPVLKVSQHLLEGTEKQLKFGVGHVTGTAMPGQSGNCVVAGHRPWPFRYLDTIAVGDSIILKMGDMVYTYHVYDSFVVLPNETWVLGDVWGEKYALTVITCTPYLVSSHRLIVRARLADINGQTPAAFYGEEEPTPPSPSPEASSELSPETSLELPPETSLEPLPEPSLETTPDPSPEPSPSAELSAGASPAGTPSPPFSDAPPEALQSPDAPTSASSEPSL
jgi:sortase A